MNKHEIAERWLEAFAENCPKEFLDKHVRARGNFLWHIFSWNQVDCLKEEAAEAAFDELDYDSAFIFYLGQAGEGEFEITDFAVCGKMKVSEWKGREDIYMVDPAFTWTFVHTHEHPEIGPFFCKKK